MSNASHKTTKNLSARELKARISTLTKECNRSLSPDEIQILLAWVDQALFDYSLVQGILGGKISVHLPAAEITSVEEFAAVMKIGAKLRLN